MDLITNNKLFLIAGPCVVEDEATVMHIAEQCFIICQRLDIPYVFKASYRKANRSSGSSFTGIGDYTALNLIQKVGHTYGVLTTTDVHSVQEVELAAAYVDILQIPAFLCRQTDLLEAAANSGKVVNIKKGQFMSPEAMIYAVDKVKNRGNDKVWLTERGTMFGYQDLVVDYRGIPTMQAFQVPVVMDCTHSLQQPNQTSGVTGGRPELIKTIASAAVAIGIDGLFIETHPNPAKALSDGANMLPIDQLEALLVHVLKIRNAIS